MGATCKSCKLTYLPPRLYCEECFEKLDAWAVITLQGEVKSHTVAHVNLEGTRLKEPSPLALITFKGVKGGVIHRLGNVGKKRIMIGMKVQPRFKPKPRRTGSMTDIEFFEPI